MAEGQPTVVIANTATCWSSSGDRPDALPRRVCKRTAPSKPPPTAIASLTSRSAFSSSGPASAATWPSLL